MFSVISVGSVYTAEASSEEKEVLDDTAMVIFDDFSDGDYTSDPEWTVYDGEWGVEDEILHGQGTISTNESAYRAYGRWEYDFSLERTDEDDDYQMVRFYFVQTGDPDPEETDGYFVTVTGDMFNQINLWRMDEGDMTGLASADWDPDTEWHTLSIERDLDNIITVYLDGDEMISDVHDDTYTSSEYKGFLSQGADHNIDEIRVAAPPSVDVITPEGGEEWEAFSQQTIQWDMTEGYFDVEHVDLFLSDDGGETWDEIVSGLEGSESYEWEVPNINSSECLVRVQMTDQGGIIGESVSEDHFTILGEPPEPPENLAVEHYGEVVRELHMTSDTHIVNGLEAYELGPVQSDEEVQSEIEYDGWNAQDRTVNWGIRAWRLDSDGNEEELTDEEPTAVVTRNEEDDGIGGIQTAGWDVPETELAPEDAVVVRVYAEIEGEIDWEEQAEFVTEPLGTHLVKESAWTVNYYTYYETQRPPGSYTLGRFYWGDDAHDSRIEGFTHYDIVEGGDHNLVTWDASLDDPDEVSHYNIYRSEEEVGPWDETTLIADVEADGSAEYSYIDEDKGMADDVFWWYVVRAVGENDMEEDNEDAVQEPGAPPSPLTPTDPEPEDEAVDVSTEVELSVSVEHDEGDNMDVSFYDASDGLIGTDNDVASGDRASVTWEGLDLDSTYEWYVIADDGEQTARSLTWSFTTVTEVSDVLPPTDPEPKDGTVDVSLNPELSVLVEHEDEENMDVSFYDASDDLIDTDNDVASGDRASVIWSGLDPATSYTWYAVADDGEDTAESARWSFTTTEAEAYFDVEIVGYDEEIHEGDELIVDYTVVNTGDVEDTQTIEFKVDGAVEDTEEVTLEVDQEHEDHFTWMAEEEGTCTISVASEDDEDEVTVSVLEELVQYELTIYAEDGGTTDPEPGTYTYPEEEEVTIEAIPDEGWSFVEWNGDAEGTEEEITIVMDHDKEITALFEEDVVVETYTLTIGVEGEGEVNIDPDQEEYEEGTEVELTASPNEGWTFVEWTGDHEGTDEVTTIIMDHDKDVNAHFAREEFFGVEILSPQSGEEFHEGDEVTVEFRVTNTGDEDTQFIEMIIRDGYGDVVFEDGEEITLASGDTHDGEFSWVVDEAGEYSVELTTEDDSDEVIVTILDAVVGYHLTIYTEGAGTTDPEPGNYTYEEGEEVTIEAIPDDDWTFVEWTGDHESEEKQITILMDDDMNITAYFEEEDQGILSGTLTEGVCIILLFIIVLSLLIVIILIWDRYGKEEKDLQTLKKPEPTDVPELKPKVKKETQRAAPSSIDTVVEGEEEIKKPEEPEEASEDDEDTPEVEEISVDEDELDIIEKFQNIRGIGPGIASTLYENGYQTIEDLKEVEVDDLSSIEGISVTHAGLLHGSIKDYVGESSEPEEEVPEVTKEEALKELKQLKGVGTSKAEALFEHGFSSIDEIKEASKEELLEVKGIGSALSEKIMKSAEKFEEK